MYEAFIYDGDGTLIDSTSRAIERLTALGPEFGYTITPDLVERLERAFGGTEDGFLGKILGLSRADEIQLYKKWEDCDFADPSPLIPGTLELFDWHEAKGHKTCFLTSRSRPTAEFLIRRHGLHDRFYKTLMRHDLHLKKPHRFTLDYLCEHLAWEHGIPREKCLMVGDSLNDLQTGRNAGIRTVIVRTGHPGAITPEHALPEEDIIDLVACLPAWLEKQAA